MIDTPSSHEITVSRVARVMPQVVRYFDHEATPDAAIDAFREFFMTRLDGARLADDRYDARYDRCYVGADVLGHELVARHGVRADHFRLLIDPSDMHGDAAVDVAYFYTPARRSLREGVLLYATDAPLVPRFPTRRHFEQYLAPEYSRLESGYRIARNLLPRAGWFQKPNGKTQEVSHAANEL